MSERTPDGRLESIIGTLLRAGVTVSVGLIAAGTVVSFAHHPDYATSAAALARLTQPGLAPRRIADVLTGLAAFRGQAVVMLGLLLLISTPILRVAVSWLAFLRERDRAFALLTSAVLLLLFLSVALGRAG